MSIPEQHFKDAEGVIEWHKENGDVRRARLERGRWNRIQVYADAAGEFAVPRLWEFRRRGMDHLYPEDGTFGQVVVNSYRAEDGRTFLLIEEVQPSQKYRDLPETLRRKLDPWREKAVEKLAQWAGTRGYTVWAMHPDGIERIYPMLSCYDVRENYLKPFRPQIWEPQPVDIKHPKLKGIDAPVRWYVYRGGVVIMAAIVLSLGLPAAASAMTTGSAAAHHAVGWGGVLAAGVAAVTIAVAVNGWLRRSPDRMVKVAGPPQIAWSRHMDIGQMQRIVFRDPSGSLERLLGEVLAVHKRVVYSGAGESDAG